jgi:hypothetical protein
MDLDSLISDPRMEAAEIAFQVVRIEKNISHRDILAGIERHILDKSAYFTRGLALGIAMMLASERKVH